jgi:hypothetical protein
MKVSKEPKREGLSATFTGPFAEIAHAKGIAAGVALVRSGLKYT